MKSHKLTLLASVFLAIAMSLPVQVALLYEHGPTEVMAIASKLTLLNWFVMISLSVSAVLMLRASPRTPWALAASMGFVTLNNFFVGYVGTDYSTTTSWLATLGFAGINIPVVRAGRQWWKVADRKQVRLPVALFDDRNWLLPAESFDLSLSGIFVSLSDPSLVERPGALQLLLSIDDESPPLRCHGRLIRSSEAKGRYPAGVGIQFVDMGDAEKRRLKNFLHSR